MVATFELAGFGEVGGYKFAASAKKFVTAQDWRRSDRGQLGWYEKVTFESKLPTAEGIYLRF